MKNTQEGQYVVVGDGRHFSLVWIEEEDRVKRENDAFYKTESRRFAGPGSLSEMREEALRLQRESEVAA